MSKINCDCSDTNGDTEMLPGVTGAMGGHSAWLQVSSSNNMLWCSNFFYPNTEL